MISTSIVSLLLLPFVAAQPASSARAIVLKAARVFDGKSDALIPGGVVIVEGKVIKAVGAGLTVPDGATVLELGDVTLCPGFIDAHTHLTHERTADFNQGFVDRMRREVAEQAILSTVYARRTVEAGFTTVRDVGSGDLLDVGLRNSIAKGVVPGPRMLVCVHALGAIGGHADTNGLRHDLLPQRNEAEGIASGPDQLRAGRPSPGKAGGRRDQVLRVRRRLVAGRRSRHASTHPCRDDRALRRGPSAAQEGRLPLPRRPCRPRRRDCRGRLDRAWVVSVGRHAAIDEGARDVSCSRP